MLKTKMVLRLIDHISLINWNKKEIKKEINWIGSTLQLVYATTKAGVSARSLLRTFDRNLLPEPCEKVTNFYF